ncbi:MAG: class I SAM-dependent methyltransferase [Gemmataceae bacterium]|nr:class I SAM-dependent methyltransferase [Gemmataceae bacterium]
MFSRCVPDWAQWLGGKRFERGLEIGSYEGASACWLLSQGVVQSLTCVDLWDPRYQGHSGVELNFDTNVAEFGNRVAKRKGDSYKVLSSLIASGAPKFQFAYVDGDHSGASALRDMVLAWELLDLHGIMILDDVHAGGPHDPRTYVVHAFSGFQAAYGPYFTFEWGGREVPQVILRKLV